MSDLKTCARCDQEKPVGEFYWLKVKDRPDSYCKACRRELTRTWNRANPRHTEKKRAWAERNRDKARGYTRRYRYGIEPHEYDLMARILNGRCMICGNRPDVLAVDHDHADDEVRGLLCRSCNLGLGAFADSPELLRRAAQYLEDHARTLAADQGALDASA
jgi:hypothetical protein